MFNKPRLYLRMLVRRMVVGNQIYIELCRHGLIDVPELRKVQLQRRWTIDRKR